MEGKGLIKLIPDSRDFSHNKSFGTLGVQNLPEQDFTVYDSFAYTVKKGDTLGDIAVKTSSTLAEIVELNKINNPNKIYVGQSLKIPKKDIHILDQTDLDFCTAFATVSLQYLIFGMQFDPLYQMAKAKQIRGSFSGFGASLRDAAKSVLRFGSLPAKLAPYTHNRSETDKDRDFLANWNNYPLNFDNFSTKYRDLSYFSVDGPLDIFDDIRSSLYLHRTERQAVLFGLNWRPQWTYAPNGVIPDKYIPSNGEGHAVAIIGQKTIKGKMYLVVQNSWSDKMGDNGIYYFPRSVVNYEYEHGNFGAYIFSRYDNSGLKGSIFESLLGVLKSFLPI